MTAKMWPWKSESSKNSVTTYLPNLIASKMDVAEISFRFNANGVNEKNILHSVGWRDGLN